MPSATSQAPTGPSHASPAASNGRSTGHVRFRGSEILNRPADELDGIRGSALSMIFQNPRTALNPIRRVGDQIADVLIRHGGATRAEAPTLAIEMLKKVRIPDPVRRARAYPFELSGGMCQRVMIAVAIACRPALLIADEPTTGLDVTTQAVIMDLIAELARETGTATIFITHDLALAAEYCDRIVVMHAGHVVESAPSAVLFDAARHPYSARLLAATPGEDGTLASLVSIPGSLPDLRRMDLPACRYSERCERRLEVCAGALPRTNLGTGHEVACWNPL